MQFSQVRRFVMYRTQNDEKQTLTRRNHVNHVTEDD